MHAVQWLAVVSRRSHLSPDKLNIYKHKTSVQSATDDQVVSMRELVQLLQAVMASRFCRIGILDLPAHKVTPERHGRNPWTIKGQTGRELKKKTKLSSPVA